DRIRRPEWFPSATGAARTCSATWWSFRRRSARGIPGSRRRAPRGRDDRPPPSRRSGGSALGSRAGRGPRSPKRRSQRSAQLGKAHLVAIAHVHVAVVELLVLVSDAERLQSARQDARAEVETPFIADAAVEVEEAKRAQRVGMTVEH